MSAPDPNDDSHGGNSLLTILAVIAGVGLLYWLTTTFLDWNKAQECAASGKRNCAPQVELNQQ
ncbi:MAG TPA: hypothetical protein VL244_02605 [Alphaproteobacteria bacterium]|nr:hypothetical protein [Alphaproteobacteria bacterium]